MKLYLTIPLVLVFFVGCSVPNKTNMQTVLKYDAYDVYECLSNDKCPKFVKGFTYDGNTNFIENTSFIKSQIAKVYLSSPDIERPYRNKHKLLFVKVLNIFKHEGIEIVDYDNDKGFLFAKLSPEVRKTFLGMKWLSMNMVIFHIENNPKLTSTNLYLVVQPMVKRPLSEVYTHIDNNKESKELKRLLVKKLEKLL